MGAAAAGGASGAAGGGDGASSLHAGSSNTAAANSHPAAVTVSGKTRVDSACGLVLRECPLCYDELPSGIYPQLSLTCGHLSCAGCMVEYLKVEIGESRVDISCPECKERLHPADIHKLLAKDKSYASKYEEFMLRRVLVTDPDTRWCPAPDCG